MPSIAARKVILNLTTLTQSIWTVAACIGVLGLFLAPADQRHQSSRRERALWLVGLASLLALNDTGIVAAGVYVSVSLPASVLMARIEGPEPSEPQGVRDD